MQADLAWLNIYWSDQTGKPNLDWEKKIDLFAVALMAKYSVPILGRANPN